MKYLQTFNLRSGRLYLVVLLGGLLCCCVRANETNPTASIAQPDMPFGRLIYISQCCSCRNSDTYALELATGTTEVLVEDEYFDYELVRLFNDRNLGILSLDEHTKFWREINLSTREITKYELPGALFQVAGYLEPEHIVYLSEDGILQQYNLLNSHSRFLMDDVSRFSLSPNGVWLGVSIHDFSLGDFIVFRVFDVKQGKFLHHQYDDIGHIGTTQPVWAPNTNAIAVVFGPETSQVSKLVVFSMDQNSVRIIASITARETYQQDYGEDLISVEFGDVVWSPDGQHIAVVRTTTDAQPGGEVLVFDTTLTTYQRLPFGQAVTRLVWIEDKRLVYVTTREGRLDSCGQQGGQIWLGNMDTLGAHVLVTDTLYTKTPIWYSGLPNLVP